MDVSTLNDCPNNPLTCSIDGQENTRAIINYGREHGFSHPAAEYCNNYVTSGTYRGDWFLPSMADWNNIYNAKNDINTSLQLLGKPRLTENYYWSSTEYDYSYSWRFDMRNKANTSSIDKDDWNYVRPVLAF